MQSTTNPNAHRGVPLLDYGDSSEQVWQEVEVNPFELYELFAVDHRAFIAFMLADELEEGDEVPDFHVAGFRLMISDDPADRHICIAWPRDHAKTTLAKLATVWRLLYRRTKFPLYLSNTNPVASAAVRDIVDMLQLPRVQDIYGRVEMEVEMRSKGQFQGLIHSPYHNRPWKFDIMSLGAGQQVRGTNRQHRRPDYLVVDDLESAEESETNQLGYIALKRWFYGTLRKALKSGSYKIVQIGNFVAAKSILGDHIASPYWNSVKLAAFNALGKPLWAAKWSFEALRQDFIEYVDAGQMHVWLAEMLNLPFGATTAGIRPQDIELAGVVSPGDPRILLRCITVDPAISSNMKRADSCVIACHVLVAGDELSGEQPYWQLADLTSRKGIGPYETYRLIMEMANKWGVTVVGIEAEAYQEALIHVADNESARAGAWFMQFVKLTTMKKSKASRIIAWSELLNNASYRVSFKHIAVLTQLAQYDLHTDNNKDDEIDCCAYIVHMIKQFIPNMLRVVQPNQGKATLTSGRLN